MQCQLSKWNTYLQQTKWVTYINLNNIVLYIYHVFKLKLAVFVKIDVFQLKLHCYTQEAIWILYYTIINVTVSHDTSTVLYS